ncbi:MAG TPA: cation:proton antiporter [Actinophytocola sp.]|uniref:cation:proton antiporter n=1 Tax=Actinophytocola sp. TaxID=1872138 RepID=UPI002F91EE19
MDGEIGINSLLAVSVVSLLAPILLGLLPARFRVPQVVVLLAGGVLIGPQVLGLGSPGDVRLLAEVGLGFVFLLAGYEVDLRLFWQDAGKRAIVGWLISVVLALGVIGVLALSGLVRAYVPVALGMTTTALGTLLPVLRERDMLSGRLGRCLLAAGAVGELFPIIAIAIFLGTQNRFVALASLGTVAVLAVVLSFTPQFVRRSRRLADVIEHGHHETSQIILRATVLLLILLIAVTNEFHLDAVLGAFLAGMVLRRWEGASAPTLEFKLDAVGYGFFVPVFFVYSGMGLNIHSIAEAPLRVLLFFALMLLIRGVPALLVYRRVLSLRERTEAVLITATTLPLLVALAEIGLRNGTMLSENAAALVGAGVLTVLVLPAIATALHRPEELGSWHPSEEQPER